MSHSRHTEASDLSRAQSRRARTVLAAIVVPLFIGTVVALVLMWPRGDSLVGSIEDPFPEGSLQEGTVTEVPADPGVEIRAELEDGTQAPVQVAPEIREFGIDVGDRIQVFFTQEAMGNGSPYVFVDFVRTSPMILLGVVYLAVVVLVARVRGLMAVVGLLAACAVVVLFLVPALMAGAAPIPTTIVAASAMMFFAVYLAHGISIRTTTALLGTFVGLVITSALAGWAVGAAELSGGSSDESVMLSNLLPGVPFRQLLIGGMILAGLGALNDVTITQASSVWELQAAAPDASRRTIFSRAMRIGRDHIASTVYTLAFAYIGVALPLILVLMLYDRPAGAMLTSGEIAEEIMRTLVSSIGLVLAIPATTLLAVLLVGLTRRARALPAEPDDAGVGEGGRRGSQDVLASGEPSAHGRHTGGT